MRLTVENFRDIGEALFGPSWQTPLADALGVAIRTVQRWSKSGPPDTIWDDLKPLCISRATELNRWAQNIESMRRLNA